jgi:hypothetical protein
VRADQNLEVLLGLIDKRLKSTRDDTLQRLAGGYERADVDFTFRDELDSSGQIFVEVVLD